MERNQTIFFYIILNIISIIVLILFMPFKFEFYDKFKIGYYCLISFVNIFFFFHVVKGFFKSWLRYDILFIIGFIIVHFQIPFLSSLGVEPEKPQFIWLDRSVVNYATWLSSIVILLWMLGFTLYLIRRKKIFFKPVKNLEVNIVKIDYFLLVLLILFLIFVGRTFLSGVYDGGENWGTGATYINLILRVTIYLRIIYLFRSCKENYRNISKLLFKNKLFCIILAIYLLLFLFAGDRGPVMQLSILIVGGYSLYLRPISFKSLFTMIALGAIFFAILKLGRTNELTNTNSNVIARGLEAFGEADQSFNPTDELASSVRIQYRAISEVPNKHPYLYGTTLAFNIVGIIPFGASFVTEITGLPLMYQSSTTFFTVLGQGPFFTSGEGSEIIGDLYINFGVYFVLIVMFLFGYFVSYISLGAYMTLNTTKVIIFLFILTTAIYANRAPFFQPLKEIIYGLLLNKIFQRKL